MKYLCLVYGEAKDLHALTPERSAKLDADSLAYDKSLERQGKLIMAEALQSVTTAKSVRKRRGKRLITDGPFAETKEQLLGFYVIDCKNLDEALDVARDLGKANPGGAYEIRPVGVLNPGSVTT